MVYLFLIDNKIIRSQSALLSLQKRAGKRFCSPAHCFARIFLNLVTAIPAAAAAAAAIIAAAAARVGRIIGCRILAQIERGEQRQGEEFVADVVGKLLAGRNGTEAVAGNQDFHPRQHLEDDGHADGQAEHIVAAVGTGYADGAGHALQRIGHDGIVGHAEQHILVYAHNALADVFHAAGVGKQDIDGDIDITAHTGEAGTIAQALDRQIGDIDIRSAGAAAFKGDGRHRRAGRRRSLVGIIAAALVHYLRITGDGHILVGQLLLLQAAIVHPLHLDTHLFVQSVQRAARNFTGTVGRVGVLIRVERHTLSSLHLPWDNPQGDWPRRGLHFHAMQGRKGGEKNLRKERLLRKTGVPYRLDT